MADVSVVIPTYNRADLLGRAIDSALDQSVPPAEIIVVDDGSTDDTPAVCARYGARLRTLRLPNGGVSAARNAGLAAARGDWIALLDSDDVWMPTKLEVQLAFLAATPSTAWSVTNCELIDGTGVARPEPQGFAGAFPTFRAHHTAPDSMFSHWMQRSPLTAAGAEHMSYAGDAFGLLFLGNVCLPSSAIVHRRVLNAVGPFDPSFRYAEETEFFHRVAAEYHGIIVMTPLVRYRVAQVGSLTSSDHTVALTQNALRSVDAAAARRPLMAAEQRALRAGRRALLLRLAYAELTEYRGSAARRALGTVIREAPLADWRAYALWAGSLVPHALLRSLHAMKRALRQATHHGAPG